MSLPIEICIYRTGHFGRKYTFGLNARWIWHALKQEQGQNVLRHGTHHGIVVDVNSEDNCLSHELIIAKAKSDKNLNYECYSHGYKVRPVLRNVLVTKSIDLS